MTGHLRRAKVVVQYFPHSVKEGAVLKYEGRKEVFVLSQAASVTYFVIEALINGNHEHEGYSSPILSVNHN